MSIGSGARRIPQGRPAAAAASGSAAAGGAASGSRGAARLPYLPGLDGLRALAVIGVLLYHADLLWLPGGFLGVEVFFVISGYLITTLLLGEWGQNARLSFKGFWLRRARRLLPAVFVLILATLAYAVFFLPAEVAGLRKDAVASAGYVTNWYLIFSNKSYFEVVGRPSLLQHLWSLAVEEQFYLVWPLLFFGLVAGLRRRRYIVPLLMAGAVTSSVLMARLYQPDVDPSRIYYGTDTRASALLLGAILAFVWAPGRDHGFGFLGRGKVRAAAGRVALELLGFASVAGLIASFILLDEFQPFLYLGGFAAVSALTAVAIAVTVHPRPGLFTRILGWAPMRWVGLRSYGLYLWHWPIFMLTRPQLDVHLSGLPLLVLRLAATVFVVELSYRFVETPIRQGALERAWRAWRESSGLRRRRLGMAWASAGLALALVSGAIGESVVRAQPPAAPAYLAMTSFDSALASSVGVGAASVSAGIALPNAVGPATAGHASPTATVTPAPDPADEAGPGAAAGPVAASPAGPYAEWAAPGDFAPGAGEASCVVALPARCVLPALQLPASWGLGLAQTGTVTTTVDAPTAPTATTAPRRAGPTVPANDLRPGEKVPRYYASPTPADGEPAQPAPQAAQQPRPPAPPEGTTAPITGTVASAATPSPVPASPAPTATPVPVPATPPRVTAIGDSVMLGAVPQLQQTLGSVDIDAAVGRQVSVALDVLRGRVAAGVLGQTLVFAVGDNGIFTAKQFDEAMAIAGNDRRVIFLTIKVPRKWEAPNNTMLAESVKRYKNAVLVDWRGATIDHPELFWDDGIHLRPEGAQLYANMIAAAVDAK